MSSNDIVSPTAMNASALFGMCRPRYLRPGGSPDYPNDDFAALPSEGPVLFTIDRTVDCSVLLHDFLVPSILAEMMIIVHDSRAQIHAHGPIIIEPVTGLTDQSTFATPLSSSIASNILYPSTTHNSPKRRTNNYD